MIRTIDEMTKPYKTEIDLTGPKGNAYYLLRQAEKLAKQLELDSDKIVEEMKESDYEHLIGVFDEYFGQHVDLFR